MDDKPFLEINMLDLKDTQIEELKKFHKSYFDVDMILSSASELKYMGELRTVIGKEFTTPSPDFVRFFGKQVYDGVFTPKVLEQFSTLVKRTINNYVSDIISDRLKAAIKDEEQPAEQNITTVQQPTDEEQPENGIVTTAEELEAFYIVKSLLRNVFPVERITYKDTRSYFGVSIDNNVRKTVCRFYFDPPTRKRLAIIDENKSEKMYKLNSINDIYNYADTLIEAANKYL